MSVAVHTDLGNGLSDGKSPPRKKGCLQPAIQVLPLEFRYPFQLLGVSFFVLCRYILDRVRSPGFHFEYKSPPEDQREPEPVGQDNMMQEVAEFVILRGFLVSANGS
jgi:hypothetical protein